MFSTYSSFKDIFWRVYSYSVRLDPDLIFTLTTLEDDMIALQKVKNILFLEESWEPEYPFMTQSSYFDTKTRYTFSIECNNSF